MPNRSLKWFDSNHVCQLDSLIKFAECYWPLSAGLLGALKGRKRMFRMLDTRMSDRLASSTSRSNDDSNLSHYCSEIYSASQEWHFKMKAHNRHHFPTLLSFLLIIWLQIAHMNRPFLDFALKGDFLIDLASTIWFPVDGLLCDPRGALKAILSWEYCSGQIVERWYRFVEFEIKTFDGWSDCCKWLSPHDVRDAKLTTLNRPCQKLRLMRKPSYRSKFIVFQNFLIKVQCSILIWSDLKALAALIRSTV